MWTICLGFAVHLVFLVSIFDIYFKSPIVHGMSPHAAPLEPPARRLVLFVADGLRADSFFGKADSCPFLREIIGKHGTWGVSHTRVPTETRPGHVALIAGLYEDPSAIAKGWKENPVQFDSVFNQSRETWSWGSPDILPMFSKGASGNHVWMDMYDAEEQDFSGKHNTTRLDLWVFDRVKKFFHEAHNDKTLLQRLHQDRIVFFLHLLGLDTAGHTHKPYSKEYEENLRAVDQGVREIVQLLEEFYNSDNRTAFIFTSDHGMTDWGSHGAGDVSETTTPLVVWGAGIGGPHPAVPRRTPASPSSWGLGHLARRDVAQADITPLMASLLGISIPVNSVGVLPKEYLDVPEQMLAELVFANARQIAAQYTRKREMTEANTVAWLYQPFPALAQSKEEELVDEIRSNIYGGRYREAVALSEVLMKTCLTGINYYETYYQALLLTCVTLAFLGWICWLLSSLFSRPMSDSNKFYGVNKLLEGGIGLNSIFLSLVVGTVYLVWSE
ncbi:GPI ethanolamine phosphate transferase 1 [Gryllus bimaculatus]|nr:GPI ethanolamine phosphate transferase 1 [Gryllus bimaculatus]